MVGFSILTGYGIATENLYNLLVGLPMMAISEVVLLRTVNSMDSEDANTKTGDTE